MNTINSPRHQESGQHFAPISQSGCGLLCKVVRFVLAVLSSLLVVMAAAPGIARAASVPAGDMGSCLCESNRTLLPGQYLQSGNGVYRLWMQGDGNLVVYAGAKALWDSQTSTLGAYLVLQPDDGNLVVYSPAGKPLWSAYVPASPSDTLYMQNDGNLVVYDTADRAQWAAMSASEPRGSTLGYNPGQGGECTWWAEKKFRDYTGAYINTLGGINGTTGDARFWGYNASHRGWSVGSTPRIGSIAVFQPGTGGAGSTGHVAWVTQVYPAKNSIVITEMNFKGSWVVDTRTISPAFAVAGLQYIYTIPT